MIMTATQNLHFMAEANTAGGYKNRWESSLQGIDRVFIIQSKLQQDVSLLLRQIALQAAPQAAWYVHNPLQSDLLSGIVIPELKLAVIQEAAASQLSLPDKKIIKVNMESAIKPGLLAQQQARLDQLQEQIAAAKQAAYSGFADALLIHDDWERLYLPHIDFDKTNKLTEQYIQLLLGEQQPSENQSRIDDRFLGTATAKGAVDYVSQLTDDLQRYHLKGRPGSGKSTILRKLAAAAIDRGYDIEVYHCGLDPKSIDMVIIRELGFAIFDSTAPHEYKPLQEEVIIDLYELTISPNTDENIAEQAEPVSSRYAALMKTAIAQLTRASSLQDDFDAIYKQCCDYSTFNKVSLDLLQDIHQIKQQASL